MFSELPQIADMIRSTNTSAESAMWWPGKPIPLMKFTGRQPLGNLGIIALEPGDEKMCRCGAIAKAAV